MHVKLKGCYGSALRIHAQLKRVLHWGGAGNGPLATQESIAVPLSLKAKALQGLYARSAPVRAGHLIDGQRLHVPGEGRHPVGPDPPGHDSSDLTCMPGVHHAKLCIESSPGKCPTSSGPG